MNKLVTGANVAMLAVATGAIADAVNQLKAHDYIVAAGLVVISLVAFVIYEKLPSSSQAE